MVTGSIGGRGYQTLGHSAEEIRERLIQPDAQRHLEALQSLSTAHVSHPALPDLVREVERRLLSLLGAERVTIHLLPITPASGASERIEPSSSPELPPDVLQWMEANRLPLILREETRTRPGPGPEAVMMAPLLVGERLLGAIRVASADDRTFGEPDLFLLQEVADRLAPGIQALRSDQSRAAEADPQTQPDIPEPEELTEVLLETTTDAIITMDPEGTILSANSAAGEIFGYDVEELIGRPLTDLIPERFRRKHRSGVERYMATRERRIPWKGLELAGLHRSGKEILLDVGFGERVKDGRHFFTGTLRDITASKRTERLLAAQYAVTRALAVAPGMEEAAPEVLQAIGKELAWDLGVFWIWSETEEVLRPVDVWADELVHAEQFEEETRRLTLPKGSGIPGHVQATHRPLWVADVSREVTLPRIDAAVRSGLHGAFAFPICIGDDCLGVVELFSCEAREPDPTLLEAMEALGTDIGLFIRRRQAEARLQEREEVQAFLAQASTVFAATALDYNSTLRGLARQAVPALADWCIAYIRRDDGALERLEVAAAPGEEALAAELLRYPMDAERAQMVLEVIHTGESRLMPEIPESLLEALAQDERHLEILRELGMASAMAVALEARGRSLGALVLVASEPARRFGPQELEVAEEFARRAALAVDNARLFHEVQEASRAKSEFLAVMSHELRTPLNAVVGYAELIRMGMTADSPERTGEYAQRIALSARHLTELIEEVLTYSRLEAGRETVTAETVAVSDLLDEIRVVAEPLAADREIQFTVTEPDHPVELYSDPGKLRQILLNLVSNAIKFTEEGEVRVDGRVDGEEVVFEVRDTGIGIPAELQERIYEPFWQVDQGTTRAVGGSGLGLSVAARLVDLLGGRLELESAPGRGSTFYVRLPRTLEESSAAAD